MQVYFRKCIGKRALRIGEGGKSLTCFSLPAELQQQDIDSGLRSPKRVGPAAAVDHVPRVDFTLRLLQLVAVQCLLDEWEKMALLQSDMGFEQLLELYQQRLQFRRFRPLQLALKPVELLMLLQHLHHCRVAELGIAQAGNQAILFQ